MSVDAWLTERLGKQRAGRSTLVLCRSRATVTRVRRYMAERGGWIGADVVTPHGLVASIYREPLGKRPEPPIHELPADNELAATIARRPGLVAVARRWVRRVRERRAVDQPIEGAPSWLVQLAESDWSRDDDATALTDALTRLRADPRRPTESHLYDRIVLLGFDAGRPILEPGAVAVAEAVSPSALPAESLAEPRPLPSIEVPDAVAEVRLAAELCLERSDDALVLVSETSTARRLRDALVRNGLSTGFTEPPAAMASALGGLVLRVVPWFTEPDPPLRVSDVAWVFGHRVLGRSLKPPAERALERERTEAGLDEGCVRPGRRVLARMLREAKVLDAPLTRWLGRLRILFTSVDRDDRIRGAALALWIRLRMLQARIAGESLGKALSAQDGPDLDDFDSLVAELLGEDIAEQGKDAQPLSLGALKEFLCDLRPRVHDDLAARAVLHALNEKRDAAADPATAREALSSPVDSSRLGVGIDVLTYDDWDGRPASRLILLDVHHKGLARRPTPDPLLTEAEQTALGVPAGQALVDFRIETVHRAAAAADEVIALVARRDAGGRDLVPPIQLQLEPIEHAPVGSYGVEVDLPERRRLAALHVHPTAPAEPPDGELAPLALQATAEWYRAGRGPLPERATPRHTDRFAPLDRHLAGLDPAAPDWVLPWLGHAEGAPEAALPDRKWSVSGLFDPLSACLYRAFSTTVLRVEKAEEIPEDLDPREIGTALHDVLEEVTTGLRLRVPHDQVDRARAEVVEALRLNTTRQLDKARDALEGLSQARHLAIEGRQERWNAHWPSWAKSRVRSDGQTAFRDKMVFVENHPLTGDAVEAMRTSVPGAARIDERKLRRWVKDTAWDAMGGRWLESDEALCRAGDRWSGLPTSMANGLRAFLETDAFRAVERTCRSAEMRAGGAAAPILATAAELPFGDAGETGTLLTERGPVEVALGEVEIELGGHPVKLRGRIDRVILSRYDSDKGWSLPLFEILDYKTGRSKPPSVRGVPHELWTGRRPQLVVYAMALQQAAREGGLGDEYERATVSAVGWDFVRLTAEDDETNRYGRFLVDTAILERVSEHLGELVDRAAQGRWTLLPRPEACPAVSPWGAYCDVSEACRLRGLPPTEEGP